MSHAKQIWWRLNLLISILLVLASYSANATESYTIEAGKGNQSSIVQAGIQIPSEFLDLNDPTAPVNGYWEPSLGLVQCKKFQNQTGQSNSLYYAGFTPVIRLQGKSPYGLFGEIAIGLNFMNKKFNNNGKIMGSQFQFGDFIGVGYKFRNNVDITLKYKHFSNAGIKEPNPAINFGIITVAYPF